MTIYHIHVSINRTLTCRKIRRWIFSKFRTAGERRGTVAIIIRVVLLPHLWRFTVFPSYSSFSLLNLGLMTLF
jgi:hypothetical protein